MSHLYAEDSARVLASTRPTLYGTRHAISAGHYLAAAAGFAILEAGGNAVDAGCAAGMALAVVEPDIVNFAGVAPIMLRMADGQVETIAGLGHWPASLPADLFMREHGGAIPPGVRRTVVPAAPDAWISALKRHGTMSFGEVAAAAIHLAADGFAVHEGLAQASSMHAKEYARWQQNAQLFLPGGRPLQEGQLFIQAELAQTIRYMADQERGAQSKGREAGLDAARDAFYRGDIARAIDAFMKQEGGYLSFDDLARFHSPIEPALRRKWRGHELMTCGPWCQGPTLITALLMFEKLGMSDLKHNSADYLHLLLEVLKLAFSDREHYYGDPAFVDVPMEFLLSDERIARRISMIRREQAMADMPPPDKGAAEPIAASRADLPRVEADTSYVCVVDKWGNALSATPSDGSWSSPIVPGLGIVPSTRGSQSRPDPRHPAGVAPGKRPRLTPNPAMLVTSAGGVMPFGSPGGDVQIQAMLQVLLNVMHFGMEAQIAVEAPRAATYSFPSSFAPFDHFPGRIALEGRIAPEVRAELARRGHEIQDWADWAGLAGSVELIKSDPASGCLAAGADPRRTAYAIAI
ncbi:MAG: gamma-glutamyltransferase [Pseudomonadota bacterium]